MKGIIDLYNLTETKKLVSPNGHELRLTLEDPENGTQLYLLRAVDEERCEQWKAHFDAKQAEAPVKAEKADDASDEDEQEDEAGDVGGDKTEGGDKGPDKEGNKEGEADEEEEKSEKKEDVGKDENAEEDEGTDEKGELC